MKSFGLLNLGLVGFSAILFGYLEHLLDVSGRRSFADILSKIGITVFFYWVAFGLVAAINRKSISEKLLGISNLVLISLVGSFGDTVFTISQNIVGDWGYISLHQNQFYARHIEPQISFFFEEFVVILILLVSAANLLRFMVRYSTSPEGT